MRTRLEHGDRTIENPSDEDIARVLGELSEGEFYLSLYRGEDDHMDVMTHAGRLSVDWEEGGRSSEAQGSIDEATAKAMLASFRDGTGAWRELASKVARDTTLDHAGESIDNPKDADIDRLLSEPRDDDWYLTLSRGEDSMEVMIDAGDLWVEVTEGDRFVQARSQIDQAIVRSMLVSFRDGTEAWRDLALWMEPPPAKKDTLKGPAGLILGLALALVSLGIVGLVAGKGGWIVVAFALAFPGIIAVAAFVKIGEAKRAAAWTKASGRIRRSELAAETRHGKEVQVPRIEYEYSVGFHKFIGKRVSLAELIAGRQAREAIARHPVGTSVPVFYNPANPSESVIERELPAFVHSVWVLVAVMTAAILFGAWWYLVR